MTQQCTSAGTLRIKMQKPLLPLSSPGVVHGLYPQSYCRLVKLACLYSLIRTHVGASETSCPNKPFRAALRSSPGRLACKSSYLDDFGFTCNGGRPRSADLMPGVKTCRGGSVETTARAA
jgi:hypothetical protein